jgi:hypothetical protein
VRARRSRPARGSRGVDRRRHRGTRAPGRFARDPVPARRSRHDRDRPVRRAGARAPARALAAHRRRGRPRDVLHRLRAGERGAAVTERTTASPLNREEYLQSLARHSQAG